MSVIATMECFKHILVGTIQSFLICSGEWNFNGFALLRFQRSGSMLVWYQKRDKSPSGSLTGKFISLAIIATVAYQARSPITNNSPPAIWMWLVKGPLFTMDSVLHVATSLPDLSSQHSYSSRKPKECSMLRQPRRRWVQAQRLSSKKKRRKWATRFLGQLYRATTPYCSR